MNLKDALDRIESIVEKYLKDNPYAPNSKKISLTTPSFGKEEIMEAIDSLLSTFVTMGKKVYKFEAMFAKYIGMHFGTMVNSGSSSNLISLEILANPMVENGLKPGDEIITPALTWSTTVFPILDVNAVPVFVDSDPNSLTIDINQLEASLSDKTRAIMPVHLLGYPCDMDYIMDFAEDNNLFVIEDCCEAHGALWNGKKVGSFGDLSSFSFFFSHHITTIEGGIVLTNNEHFNNLAKSLRAHGWVRERPDKDELIEKYSDLDSRFLFVNKGYNLRPTEIQGAFGIHQIEKLESFIKIRETNADYWISALEGVERNIALPVVEKNVRHAWFGFPLIVKDNAPYKRTDIISYLESNGIETRPIMAGNMAKQPGIELFNWRKIGNLEIATDVMNNGFFFGNHPGIGKKEREYIVEKILEFDSKF